MLFHTERHEALQALAWDAGRALQGLRVIAAELQQEQSAAGGWALHPQDDEGDEPPGGFQGMYIGTAGVLWALWWLQRQGAVTLDGDPAARMPAVLATHEAHPDTGQRVPSLFMGEAGVLLLHWRMTGSALVADRLHAVVQANVHHPSQEAFLGSPGTMLAAWHLWTATRETRWRNVFLAGADALWSAWQFDPRAGAWLWTQDLYGSQVQYIGAGHGWAGNVHVLLKGAALLDAPRRDALQERCVATLQALARHAGDAVNWPPGTFVPRPGRPSMLMQWCHGAPGIVTALADLLPGRSPALDALLQAAGQAIWQAGPLAKGPGLCHGTAGNGAALLALHARTGEALWLARAQAYAMHALAQSEAARGAHGRCRATLWTGDAGLAVFLWQCLQGTAGMPVLDFIG